MLYEVPFGRINEMADAAAEAFIAHNDPIGNFMFHNEPEQLILKQRFFRALVTSCSPSVVRQATSVNLEAVSIWFPPGIGHSQDVEGDRFEAKDFSNPETITRMRAVNEVITTLTTHLGQEPQWYLHLVAVRPQYKGCGYASQLVRPMLARAKHDGFACTLITQSMENVKKYEHWGFRIHKEMAVPCAREKFYSMRKD